jgi:hypothetical protein
MYRDEFEAEQARNLDLRRKLALKNLREENDRLEKKLNGTKEDNNALRNKQGNDIFCTGNETCNCSLCMMAGGQ